jgi:hypothetical protein
MLEKLSDVPDSVLGFRASGELTGDDYRNVLVLAVEAALQRRDNSGSATSSAKTSPDSRRAPPGRTPRWAWSTSPGGRRSPS